MCCSPWCFSINNESNQITGPRQHPRGVRSWEFVEAMGLFFERNFFFHLCRAVASGFLISPPGLYKLLALKFYWEAQLGTSQGSTLIFSTWLACEIGDWGMTGRLSAALVSAENKVNRHAWIKRVMFMTNIAWDCFCNVLFVELKQEVGVYADWAPLQFVQQGCMICWRVFPYWFTLPHRIILW